MINIQANSYNKIMRLKKCYELANYYTNITENIFEEMYEFLEHCEEHKIVASNGILSFIDGAGKTVKTFAVMPKDIIYNKIIIDNEGVHIS